MLEDFHQRLHGVMTDANHSDLVRKTDGSLNNYKECILHLGKLTFCICVFILFASAVDGYRFATWTTFLFSLAYAVYAIYIMIPHTSEWIFRMWSFVWAAAVGGVLIFIPLALPCDKLICPWLSEQLIGAWLVLLMTLVPILGILRYYWEKRVFDIISKEIDEIETSFQSYTIWKSMPTKASFDKIKDPEILDIILTEKPVAITQNRVDNYFCQKINATFDILRINKLLKLKIERMLFWISRNKPGIIFDCIVILSILFYIFVVLMTALNR